MAGKIVAQGPQWGSDLNLGAYDEQYFNRRQYDQTYGSGGSADPNYGSGNAGPVISGYNAPARGAAAMPMSMEALTSAPGYARGAASTDANVSQGAYDRQQEIQLAHDLRMQEMSAKNDTVKQLLASYGGGATPSRVTRSPEDAAKEQAGRDAAFARAKEKAGQTARASMAALSDAVAETGMMGSSVHAQKQGAIIGGAAGNIGEFLRDQAITESDRVAEVSDMDFQAQVAQRGQEMAKRQAIISLLGSLY